MERDFMGLAVKQETPDHEVIDAVPLRSSGMHWSFQNKASDKPKNGFSSLASPGLITITTQEASDSDHKSYSGAMQKNIIHEKQAGVHYTVTTYPTKHIDSHAIHRPVANQTNPTVLPAAVRHSFVAAAGHNVIDPSTQPLAAVPIANPVPAMPSSSPIVGTTDLRNASNISSQLTIFYNGAVCVYDNISPDKAHAIMLLAGNRPPSMTSSKTGPLPPVQTSMPKSSVLDDFVVRQPYGTTVNRSSSTAMTSTSVSHSAGNWPGSINATSVLNQGPDIISTNKVEPLKVVSSPGLDSATYLSSGTVPQFRKKSLARFLERRKERVINSCPYAKKQSPEGNTTPGAGNASLTTEPSSSCHVANRRLKEELNF